MYRKVCIGFICLVFSGCFQGPTGPQGPSGISDKQIRLETLLSDGSIDTIWDYLNPSDYFIKFNKNNYVNVDSIIFVVNAGSADVNTFCLVELFNAQDLSPINGGLISSNDTSHEPNSITPLGWAQTGNIFNSLPNEESTIGIRVKSSKQGNLVVIDKACLFLYRH